MPQSRRMQAHEIQSLAFASIGPTYTAIGVPLTQQMRVINMTNLTDATIMFSFDGSIDHFILPTGGFFLFDIATNRVDDGGFFCGQGTQLYARHIGVAPTMNAVYLSSYYAFEVPRE